MLMKTSIAGVWVSFALNVLASAQSATLVTEPVVRGKVVVANPRTNVMTVMVEPGNTPMEFYGLERASIELSRGRAGTWTELRPGTTVAVYYTTVDGRWYPQRILIPDANLAVPVSPLTPAENKALDSKAANDGDITTNPGVKARIDRDITTQPGKKDPADPDITKKSN
jgi:hypothetical protein